MERQHGTEWEWPPGEPLSDQEREVLSTNIVRGLVHVDQMVTDAKDHLKLQGGDCPKCCIGEKVGNFIESIAQDTSERGMAGVTLLLALSIRTLAEQEMQQELKPKNP